MTTDIFFEDIYIPNILDTRRISDGFEIYEWHTDNCFASYTVYCIAGYVIDLSYSCHI